VGLTILTVVQCEVNGCRNNYKVDAFLYDYCVVGVLFVGVL
jgi:hypothetical protein